MIALDSLSLYFPNSLASPEEKATEKYGIQYARAIWARYNADLALFSQQKNRWILNRKYAEGLQSVEKYKDRFDVGDTSWMNLDYTPPSVIPKFVDNIVGLLSNQKYKVEATVLNSTSKTREDEERNKLYAAMLLKPVSDQMQQQTGIPMLPPNQFVPKDEEELELYMQQNFKSDDAMAMELAIQFVLNNNDFSDIEEKLIRDLVNLKIAAVKRYYDKNKNIKCAYVDPVDLIFPYSKYDDFRNIPWCGYIPKYTIQEISNMTDKFTEADLYDMAKSFQGSKYGNRAWNWSASYEGYYAANGVLAGRPYDDFNIPVLEFEFLGIDSLNYKKKKSKFGGEFFDKTTTDYAPPENSGSEVIKKTVTNRYEGYWVVGSEKYIWGYGKSNNIPREKVDGVYSTEATLQTKIIAPNIYDMQNKSLTERMIPHGDQLALINLKIQHLLMKAIPPGIYVDQDAIENVMRGVGSGNMQPLEVIKMFTQTGSLVGRSRREDGSIINGEPIKILPNGIPPGFEILNQMWESEMAKIYAVIGYNQATDGSQPSSEALVGVQQIAVQSTSNSLRPLSNSFLKLIRKFTKDLGLMIQDKIEYSGTLEGFERAIGKESINVIKAAKGLPLCEFGITINYLPNEAEKAEVTNKINIALQEKSIELQDAVRVEECLKSNVKLAIQLLVYLQKQRRNERMEEAKANSQNNSQQQQESAMAASQGKMQEIQAEVQGKAQLMEMEYQLKSKLSAQESTQRKQEILLQSQGKVDAVAVEHEGKLLHLAFEKAVEVKEEVPAK